MTRRQAGAAALACGFGVGLTALLASGNGDLPRIDDEIIVRLHAHDSGLAHGAARLANRLGDPVPQLALAVGAISIALRRRRIRAATAAALVIGGAGVTTQILKSAVTMDRYEPAPGLVATNLHSFPSGHVTAMIATTIAWLLVVPRRSRLPVAVFGAGLTTVLGLTVVVLHDHWPSDVIGGALVGCTWGLGATAVLGERR